MGNIDALNYLNASLSISRVEQKVICVNELRIGSCFDCLVLTLVGWGSLTFPRCFLHKLLGTIYLRLGRCRGGLDEYTIVHISINVPLLIEHAFQYLRLLRLLKLVPLSILTGLHIWKQRLILLLLLLFVFFLLKH